MLKGNIIELMYKVNSGTATPEEISTFNKLMAKEKIETLSRRIDTYEKLKSMLDAKGEPIYDADLLKKEILKI